MKTRCGEDEPIVMADFPATRMSASTTCGVCGCAVPAGSWVVLLDVGVLVCSASCMVQCDVPTCGVEIADLEQQAKDLEREAENLRYEADELTWKAEDIRVQIQKIKEARRAIPLLEVA